MEVGTSLSPEVMHLVTKDGEEHSYYLDLINKNTELKEGVRSFFL